MTVQRHKQFHYAGLEHGQQGGRCRIQSGRAREQIYNESKEKRPQQNGGTLHCTVKPDYHPDIEQRSYVAEQADAVKDKHLKQRQSYQRKQPEHE